MMAVPPLFFAVFWLFAEFAATLATVASCHYGESLPAGPKIPYPLGYQNRKRL
jgi:hypothetical protein